MAYAMVGGGWTLSQRLDSPGRKNSIQKQAPWLCRIPDCYATSAWSILRSEGAYTLNLRLDSSVGRGGMLGPVEGLCLANGSGA